MTYEEFMQWTRQENIPLNKLDIYPNRYTNVPFSAGCYRDAAGDWYYYWQTDERTSLTPNGEKMSEEECFDTLKRQVSYKLQVLEEEREKQRRKALEKKQQSSPVHKEDDDAAVQELFREENLDAETADEVIIDIEKIYCLMDDTDEGNSNYASAKRTYTSLYSEQTAVNFLKIYKYMDKLGKLIQQGPFMQVDVLILQKVGLVFSDMNVEEDKKIIEANKRMAEGSR